MTKAIIIDDEQHCIDNLHWLLKNNCADIDVIAMGKNGREGIELINRYHPQLIFLDVEMPDINGFEMLQQLPEIDFDIIFTTAFNQYAIRAIKFGALDYLVKPVNKEELIESVNKHLQHAESDSLKQLEALLSHVKKNNNFSLQKIALPTIHGYELVPLQDILMCESNNNYTSIKLIGGRQIVISKTLKQIEELLDMKPFLRIHNSYLVNLKYAIRYIKGEGGFLVLKDTTEVPVSRSKKQELLTLITQLSV